MIKLLAICSRSLALILVFSMTPLVWGMEIEENTDMYPDEKPKSKCIFTLDLSQKQKWEDKEYDESYKDINIRRNQINATTREILREVGFIFLPGYFCPGNADNKISSVFGNFISGKLKNCLIVECQYHERSLSTRFEKIDGYTETRTHRPLKEKWNILSSKADSDYLMEESCTELSWKWVNFALHNINFFVNKYTDITDPIVSTFCKRLYEKIKRKSLEKTFIRLSVVVNTDRYYSFNVIFNNENEEKIGKNFLLEIKDKLSKNFPIVFG